MPAVQYAAGETDAAVAARRRDAVFAFGFHEQYTWAVVCLASRGHEPAGSDQRNRRFRSVLEEHEVITRYVPRVTYCCLDSE